MSFSSLIGRAVFSQKDSARLAKAYFDGLSTLNSSSLYVFTVLIPIHELISMQKAASRHRGIFMAATQTYSDASRRQKCHKHPVVYLWPVTRSLVVAGCEKCVLSFTALLSVGFM